MEKILIGSLESSTTRNGAPCVELYAADTRLKFPVLRLFDLSALIAIGLDPNDLPAGRHVARFFAYYTESEKLNERGNPYKDISHLEPITAPATASSTDTTPILEELREIKAMLAAVLVGLDAEPALVGLPGDDPQPEPPTVETCPNCATVPCICPQLVDVQTGEIPGDAAMTYGDGRQVDSDNLDECQAYRAYLIAERKKPPCIEHLRNWIQDTPKPRQKPADVSGLD